MYSIKNFLRSPIFLCVTATSLKAMESHELSTQLVYAACTGDTKQLRHLIATEKPNKNMIQKAFIWAAEYGQIHAMQKLLDRGAHINRKDQKESTALDHAAGHGHFQAVAYLLEQGAEIDTVPGINTQIALDSREESDLANKEKGDSQVETTENYSRQRRKTALMWAAGSGHPEIVQLLLARGALLNSQDDKGNTALHWAAGQATWNKKREPMTPPITNTQSAELANNTPETESEKENELEKETESLTITDKETIQNYCLPRQIDDRTEEEHNADYTDTVNILLSAGANATIAGDTGMLPLHSAIVSGNIMSAQAIIAAAPNQQVRQDMINACENSAYKRTPLLLALRHSEGAPTKNYDKLNSHATTLALMRLLITNGADINKKDATGRSPLTWAHKKLKASAETALLTSWQVLLERCKTLSTMAPENPKIASTFQMLNKELMTWANTQSTDTQTVYDIYNQWRTRALSEFNLEMLAQNYPHDPQKILEEVRTGQARKYIPRHLRNTTETTSESPTINTPPQTLNQPNTSAPYRPPHRRQLQSSSLPYNRQSTYREQSLENRIHSIQTKEDAQEGWQKVTSKKNKNDRLGLQAYYKEPL